MSTYDEGRWGALRGATTTIVNNALYLLGGYGVMSEVVPNLWVWKFDILGENAPWEIEGNRHLPCADHVTVLYNGHLHTLGGNGRSISHKLLGGSTALPNEFPRAFSDAVTWEDVVATCTQ